VTWWTLSNLLYAEQGLGHVQLVCRDQMVYKPHYSQLVVDELQEVIDGNILLPRPRPAAQGSRGQDLGTAPKNKEIRKKPAAKEVANNKVMKKPPATVPRPPATKKKPRRNESSGFGSESEVSSAAILLMVLKSHSQPTLWMVRKNPVNKINKGISTTVPSTGEGRISEPSTVCRLVCSHPTC